MFVATWAHCSCAQCWMDLPGLTRGGGGGEGSLLQLVTGSLITIHWTRLSVSFLCTQCIKIIVIVEFSFAPFCWEKNSLVLLSLLSLLLLLMMLPLYSLLNFSNSFCVCNKYLVPFHPTELQRNSSLKLELKEFSVEKPTAVSRIRCKEHGTVTLTEVPDSKSYQVDGCCKQSWRQNSDLMKSRNDFSPGGQSCCFWSCWCCQRDPSAAIGIGRRQLSKQIFRWKEIRRLLPPPPSISPTHAHGHTCVSFPPGKKLEILDAELFEKK